MSTRVQGQEDLLSGSNDEPAPRLTIEILFFKHADYLRRAVESVLALPRGPWILVIVDNSVDEREHAAAKSLAASYAPNQLRYYRNNPEFSLHEKNKRHLEIAETDLVAIAHGDDEVLPCYAGEFLDLAARHPEASVLFTGARTIDKDSRPCFSFVDWYKRLIMPRGRGDFVLSGERSLCSLLRGNWIYGGAACYRKSLLGDLHWDIQNWFMTSDLEFWCRVILSGRTIVGTKRADYLYRRHSTQTTAQQTGNLDRFREESRFFDVIADRASAKGWESAAAVARSKTIVKLYLMFLIARDIARGSFRGAGQKLKLIREVWESARKYGKHRRRSPT